jgi:hypothetical protein
VNGFQLANRAAKKDEVSVTILCRDLEDKKAWTREIKTYIKMYQKQEAKRRKVMGAAPNATAAGALPFFPFPFFPFP